MPDVGLDGLAIIPAPETSDHIPVPTMGMLPAKDVVTPQIVWSAPALATVIEPD